MLDALKAIYRDGFIEHVQTFQENYYYFYVPSSQDIFGITKSITQNEYQLLKLNYVEKTIYTPNTKIQQLMAYLFEEASYPFSKRKMKFLIYSKTIENQDIIDDLLSKVYHEFISVDIYGCCIAFYQAEDITQLDELFQTLSVDLGVNLCVHEGFYIHQKVKGSTILAYMDQVVKHTNLMRMSYSDVSEAILTFLASQEGALLHQLKDILYTPYFDSSPIRDILEVMIKQDLNVSSTAKYLYMNRNSLMNKIDNIEKETGLNLQKFKHACAIYILSKVV
ncbi:MAG: helix-turn-helix domain-containing protein [Prevotella sp.]|nr:helix-turn-helix domain-containing protein [Staphylococcus sp.]MCM1351050.1 helix-turn-helix domain-containing protein [Prevotella sp.]